MFGSACFIILDAVDCSVFRTFLQLTSGQAASCPALMLYQLDQPIVHPR